MGQPLLELAEAYEVLPENDANLFGRDLFDSYRDEFRDRLSPLDSIRTGQVGVSSTAILDHMLPSASRAVRMSHARSSPLLSPHPQSMNLQYWLDLWRDSQQARHAEGPGIPFVIWMSRDSIRSTTLPPMLFFEHYPVAPCKSIAVPHLRGVARCDLVGMIYLGRYHFSARFCADGRVWNHDGCINNGDPFLEPGVQDFDLCTLQQSNSHRVHVFLYALQAFSPR